MDVMILVCALSITAPDCQKATAQHVFFAPPSEGSLVTCAREGLMYAAQSNLVTEGTYAKIFCQAHDRTRQKAEAH